MTDKIVTVEEIHADFYSQESRLVNEANDILLYSGSNSEDILAAKKMVAKGFTSSKCVREVVNSDIVTQELRSKVDLIDSYRKKYPLNRFIDLASVEKLCKKYNLVFGSSQNFDPEFIPKKNMREIANFELKEEDCTLDDWSEIRTFTIINDVYLFINNQTGSSDQVNYKGSVMVNVNFGCPGTWPAFEYEYSPGCRNTWYVPPYDCEAVGGNIQKKAEPMMVVANKECFIGHENMEIKDGFMLVAKDPIVLQPVAGGYLIVSAWGLEAADESVVNSINN